MKIKKNRMLIVFFLLSTVATVCYQVITKDDPYETLEGEIFSTHYKVNYQSNSSLKLNPLEIQSAIDTELNRIEWIASSWKKESEINRYVRAENKEKFPLSEELNYLLEHSREMEKLTSGAFNIEHQKGKLDLSGIAKGYAVDRIAHYLTEDLGIKSFLVDIGGEIKAKGINPKGEPWTVGIFAPPNDASIQPPKVKLENTSIATSGNYYKGSHIIDPKTGNAATNSLISVSVIHPSNTTADALATALFVMGPDKGMTWAEKNKILAIFILEDGTILPCSTHDD